MRLRSVKLVVSVAVLAVLSPCGSYAAERLERTLDHEEPIAGRSLHVENLIGSIEVRGGGAEGTARVEADIVVEAKTAVEAAALLEAIRIEPEAEDGRTVLRVSYPLDDHAAFRLPKSERGGLIATWVTPLVQRKRASYEYDGRGVEIGNAKGAAAVAVHLRVTLPAGADASFHQVFGPIDCQRGRGRFALRTDAGPVTVGRLYGDVEVETSGSTVQVTSLRGEGLSVQSGAGAVELDNIQTDRIGVQTTSGRVRGNAIMTSALTVRSESGPVRLDDFEATTLDVATVSGPVELETWLKRTEEVAVETSSGNVTLRVGKLTSFELEARTGTGEVRFRDLPAELVRREEGVSTYRYRSGGKTLRISTGGGDVVFEPL